MDNDETLDWRKRAGSDRPWLVNRRGCVTGMGKGREASEKIQEIWTKTHGKWQGDDADAFYKEYTVKIMENAGIFEESCRNLSKYSLEFAKELQVVRQSMEK